LNSALAFRTKLLEALKVEPEWLIGEMSDQKLVWIPSVLGTEFEAKPSGPDVPLYGVLKVRTRLLKTRDFGRASDNANLLNNFTSMTRWVISQVYGSEEPEYVMSSELTFVVGSEFTDITLNAAALAVSEQIAKATAMCSEDFYGGWGEPLLTSSPNGIRYQENWNEIVDFFNSKILPASGMSSAALFESAVKAFDEEVQFQLGNDYPAWFGNHDETTLVFEVPFDDAEFFSGVIASIQPISGERYKTSLVTVQSIENPHLGNGVLTFLRIPSGAIEDVQPSTVNELNLHASGDKAGCTHGLGAWVLNGGELKHGLFVPASWLTYFTEPALTQLFRVIFENLARVSWTAKTVLQGKDGHNANSFGLAAPAERARGPHFGELGMGC
jgi:hypothetical protein